MNKIAPRQQWQVECSAGGDLSAIAAPIKPAPRKRSKSKSSAEEAHLDAVAAMPCVICEALGMAQAGPTYVHHMREGAGLSQRNSHFLTLPLCHEHHQGKTGIHGNRAAFKLAKLSELDCLAIVISRMKH